MKRKSGSVLIREEVFDIDTMQWEVYACSSCNCSTFVNFGKSLRISNILVRAPRRDSDNFWILMLGSSVCQSLFLEECGTVIRLFWYTSLGVSRSTIQDVFTRGSPWRQPGSGSGRSPILSFADLSISSSF